MSSTGSTEPRVTVLPAEGAEPALAAALADAAGAWAAALEPRLPPGAVAYVRADMPTFEPRHADAVLGDLADGCEISVGPSHDGGWYLLALAHPHPDVLSHEMDDLFRLVSERGWGVGMLRGERRLLSPADVPALLLDPRLPDAVRALLETG